MQAQLKRDVKEYSKGYGYDINFITAKITKITVNITDGPRVMIDFQWITTTYSNLYDFDMIVTFGKLSLNLRSLSEVSWFDGFHHLMCCGTIVFLRVKNCTWTYVYFSLC